MKLSQILDGLDVISLEGGPDTDIYGITHDSRRAGPGFIFAAVKGVKTDGANFIGQAVEKGAAAVIYEEYEGPRVPGIAYVRVADGRKSMALAAANFYGRPTGSMKVVGITGTNGKTTTSYIIKSILDELGLCGIIGTVGYTFNGRTIPAPNTTPESVELQALFFEMAASGVASVVMEVSSHAIALDRIAGTEFSAKVFTNFTQDHLDFHGGMEEYYAAKKAFFTEGGAPCVINMDDPRGADLAASAAGPVTTYAVDNTADVTATRIRLGLLGTVFTLSTPAGTVGIETRLVGRHNVYNILSAAGAALALGIPLATIKTGVEKADGVPGRLERVDTGQDFTVLVDYAHTEDALENVMRAAREFTPGRLITVFGCGGDRDRTKRPKMGRAAARMSDIVVLTSDNPRTEDPAVIMAEAEAGIIGEGTKSKGESWFSVADRGHAIALAVSLAAQGDTVLIAGKGHEDYQIIGETKFHFDDREAARAAILERVA